MGSLGGRYSLFPSTARQGRAVQNGHVPAFMSSWQVEGCSLLVSQNFDFGIFTMPVCIVDKRAKFLPPLWDPVISLHVSLDPLARVIGVNISPFS